MMMRVFCEQALFGGVCISGLDRLRKVLQVGASLPDQFETRGLSVSWMNRRYAIFSKRFELIQSREPAFQMSFLQIEVRLVVDQIRRKTLHAPSFGRWSERLASSPPQCNRCAYRL